MSEWEEQGIPTEELIEDLLVRISDQLQDPEPQWDPVLSGASEMTLRALESVLKGMIDDQSN